MPTILEAGLMNDLAGHGIYDPVIGGSSMEAGYTPPPSWSLDHVHDATATGGDYATIFKKNDGSEYYYASRGSTTVQDWVVTDGKIVFQIPPDARIADAKAQIDQLRSANLDTSVKISGGGTSLAGDIMAHVSQKFDQDGDPPLYVLVENGPNSLVNTSPMTHVVEIVKQWDPIGNYGPSFKSGNQIVVKGGSHQAAAVNSEIAGNPALSNSVLGQPLDPVAIKAGGAVNVHLQPAMNTNPQTNDPEYNPTVVLNEDSQGGVTGTVISKNDLDHALQLAQTNLLPNGTLGTSATADFDPTGSLQDIDYPIIFSQGVSGRVILDNNQSNAPAGTTLNPNQFYVSSDYNTISTIASNEGVSQAALIAANPGSTGTTQFTVGTKINLPGIDNSEAPTIVVSSSPQAQTGVAGEGDAFNNVLNGYTEESLTESISFASNFLNATDSVSTTEALLATGEVRPGERQLYPGDFVNAVLEDGELDPTAINAGFVNAATFGSLAEGSLDETYVDPLLLDLTGTGIGTTSLQNSPVLFDMNHSGTQQRTGWVDTQTGILVVPDANGQVTNVSQMFSEFTGGTAGTNGAAGSKSFPNGFYALGNQDSNNDGVITSSDAIWSQLRVWVDSNHDATVETGELKTLASLGITQFNLGNSLGQGTLNGNPVTASSTFVMNGQSRTLADVNLISDSASNVFTTSGTGTIVTTTSTDSNGVKTTVKTYKESSKANTTLNAATLNVDHVEGGSGNDTLIAKSTGSWLIGDGGSNTYQGGAGNDTFVVTASDDPANVHSGGGQDTLVVTGTTGMTVNMAQMGVTIAEGGAGNDVIMSGGRAGVYIKGGSGTELLIGGAGTDVIVGGSGHNTIIGGTGQAVIYAGPNGDLIYGAKGNSVINAGGGKDTIIAGSGDDVIKVGMGNANIDGGGGTNIVQFHGSYGDYQITKAANGYWISDKVTNRDGTAFITNVQKLNFSDVQAVDLSLPNAMPVADILTVDKNGNVFDRTQSHLISAAQLIANDQALSSVGGLHISAVSDAVGGTVSIQSGDVLFTPSASFTGIMSFKYTVQDAQGHTAMSAVDAATGQSAVMKARVTLETSDVPTDPLAAQEWYLNDTNVIPVWKDYTGEGVRIGQFEPGDAFAVGPEVLNYNNPDLAPNVDSAWLTNQRITGELPASFSNHATMVAGVMVAARNGSGAVGVAYNATVGSEYLDPATLANWGNMAGYDVANNSWGYSPDFNLTNLDPNTSESLGDIALANAQYAASNGRGGKGTIIVESAGNTRSTQGTAEGSLFNNNRFSIEVGAINQKADLSTLAPASTPFSSPGASLLVSAPGSNIASTSQLVVTDQGSIFGSNTDTMQGTSFSTPIVSAITALMLEANPNLGYRDVQTILAMSAHTITESGASTFSSNHARNWNGGGMHTSNDYGFGEVDALAAVRLAETWTGQKTGANEAVVSGSSSTVLNITAGHNNSSSITMASGVQVEHAEVDLNLGFGHLKDVTVTLIAPNGTQSVLLSNNDPSNTSTSLQYTFMSTHDWGEQSTGSWTLQVADAATGSPVAVNGWGLRLYGSTASADDTYFYTNEYAAQVVQSSARATLNDSVNGTSGGINAINAVAITGNTSINLLTGAASLGGTTLTIQNPTNFNNIFTGDGNDTLVANNNKAILDGGRGNDTLTGGTGKDIFVVRQNNNGQVTINNFNPGNGEVIDLVGFTGLSFAQLTKTQQGSDVLIGGLGGGQNILVKNITASALTSAQFVFQDTFVAPAGYTTTGNSNNTLVTGTPTITLQGGFAGPVWNEANGKLVVSLSGTVYQHDLATSDKFVIGPKSDPTGYYNALQGFKPGIDKIDIGQIGILNSSDLVLTPLHVSFGDMNIVQGTFVMSSSQGDSTNGPLALVYLDSILPSQLKASDFIFSGGQLGDPNSSLVISTPFTPNSQVPLNTTGSVDPNLVGSNNGVTISPDGTTVTSSVDYVLPNAINKLVLTGVKDLVGTGNNNGDTITSNTGQDTLIGGTGNDMYIVNNSNDVVVENPASGTDSVQASVSYALNDNIESLTLTGTTDINGTGNALNNVITGNSGANVLDGSTGSDTMIGGLGNDTYVVDSTGDMITENANEGIDTVQSSISYTLTNANLENLTLTGTAALNGTGNNGDNVLTGNSAANSLSGGAGNDTLIGNGGNDTLDGGLGNDTYQFLPNYGTDTILDAGGTDTLDFSLFTTNVSVSLGSNVINGDPGNSISWTNSPNAMENLTTGSGNDTLNGSSLANVLTGNDGNDTMIGLAGNDTMNGGAGDDSYLFADGFGADSITDTSGNDTLDFSLVTAPLTYNATTGSVTNASNSVSFAPATTTFEKIIGGNGNDSFTGGSFAETFVGGAGNDTLNGGNGNDTYLYANGWGSDSITAGSSIETVDMSAVTTALNVNMASGAGNEVSDGTNLINWTGTIENITTGSGIDTINGTSGDNYITSGAGSDAIWAAGGNDTIDGGAGNDRYVYTGAWGNDSILDASGTDQLDFSTDASNVTYNLTAGAGNEVTDGTSTINWTGDIIENVKAGTGNDSIMGSSGANSLSGGAGNDTLNGGLGNDTLDGGAGDDVYQFLNGFGANTVADASGNDTFDFSQITSAITYNATGSMTSGSSSLSFTGVTIENVLGGSGADSLTGSGGSDSFTGGAGNDTLNGGAGNDTYFYANGWGNDSIVDASGVDTVNLSAVTTALNVNMAASSGNEVSDGTSLINWSDAIENLTTGSGSDTVNGTSGDNVITLGAGNDAVWGAAGNDTLDGGDGNDRYVYTGVWGNDSILDSSGTDTLDFRTDASNLTVNLTAGAGNEATDGTSTLNWTGNIIENVWAGTGTNVINGNSSANSLIGGTGLNTLNGGAGNDTLQGGTGNSTYQFALGDGQDTITETGGTDVLTFNSSITQANVAFFQTSTGNLQVGYANSTGDVITIQGQTTAASAVEKFQLSNGNFMTSADVNLVLQQMTSYASSHSGTDFSSLSAVENNTNLMNIVNSGWHA